MPKLSYRLQRYRSPSANSGVTRFATGTDYIVIEFKSGEGYLYDHTSPGRKKVAVMKKLAASGTGLATFINRHVRSCYAKKLW